MLCKNCHNSLSIFLEERRKQYLDAEEGIMKLTTSGAREGCFICTRVCDAEQEESRPIAGSAKYLGQWKRMLGISSYHKARFYRFQRTLKVKGASRDVSMLVTKTDPEYAERCAEADRSDSTGSEASFNLARYLLRTCLDDHEQCKTQRRSQWYPRRLLRVESLNVRLVHTTDEKPTQPYATLSYCWGGATWEVLTHANMAKFVAGVAISTFPPLFQDIFRTIKELDLLYIWIDSFCIVQNSDSDAFARDKQIEIAEMALVYTNSALNIGATHARDPYQSCFVLREMKGIQPQFAKIRTKSGKEPGAYHLDDVYRDRAFWRLPLFTRAWVLQERILCPRMLHFERTRISWECRQWSIHDGDAPVSELQKFELQNYHDERAFSLERGYRSRPLEPPELVLHPWHVIVAQYSGLSLSRPAEDKFNAIAGLARCYAEIVKDVYIVGFFQKRLLPSLCWHLKDKPTHPIFHRTRRAPTWSWASIDDRITFVMDPPLSTTTVAELGRVEMQLLNPEDPFGAVISAGLHLSGTLLRVQILSADPEKHFIASVTLTKKEPDPDGLTFICEVYDYFDEHWDPICTDYIVSPIWASYIAESPGTFDKWRNPDNRSNLMDSFTSQHTLSQMHCLILTEHGEEAYQRIGMCTLANEAYYRIPKQLMNLSNVVSPFGLIESSPKRSITLI